MEEWIVIHLYQFIGNYTAYRHLYGHLILHSGGATNPSHSDILQVNSHILVNYPLLNKKVLTYMKLGLLYAIISDWIDNLFVKCWKISSSNLILSLIIEGKDEKDFTHFINTPF